MYEVNTAVVGTVITNPVKRSANGEEVISFRMASNARRQDRGTGEWVDSGTLYLSVSCWRRLVAGVGASIMVGDPIVAYGQLRTNEYTSKDGVARSDLEMRASAIGPDLARCIVKIERPKLPASQDPAATASTTDREIEQSTPRPERHLEPVGT
ncbi:single-stranded DNA-binding protein [Antrihabitans sp. YC3-6]|uniref:Single-stranded DNA-binding protein n=1 Tax=Antrihabitans stalagmiti TaxID=2799499 RepID=A0A934U6B0_9NOCA|nr:single-stranded DNA-binding protein [Antrihabitans stalagmiti]MBJ8342390.1 single-stranded DNA-binding protein [Antrihabitans stalagmiti]